MLALGWSDGFSFTPLDVVVLSYAELSNRLYEMTLNLSKHSNGFLREKVAFSLRLDTVVTLLERALRAGFTADYVLMDS